MNTDRIYATFGNMLRLHRTKAEMTQQEIAGAVGLSRTSIANIEKGRQKILMHQIFEFARALHISPLALLPPEDVELEELGTNISTFSGLDAKERGFVSLFVPTAGK